MPPRLPPPPDGTRFELLSTEPTVAGTTMAREVRAGLLGTPRSIPPKYFYDDVGSKLFDEICELPEYYLTRAERALLVRFAAPIVNETGADSLLEIGSGMARKTAPLLAALCARSRSPVYVPFDIAPEPIVRSAQSLLDAFPSLRVRGIVGDFGRDCARLEQGTTGSGPRLFAFLGSTIGNLDEHEAPAFLRSIAALMRGRDRFLLGVDLVKDVRVLQAAYNDGRGVTAAFNRNVLAVLARELHGTVDETAFRHRARYDTAKERIEMHLVAERRALLRLPAADVHVDFAAGDEVLTEISRKFTRASVERMLEAGGMRLVAWMIEPKPTSETFALCLACRALPGSPGLPGPERA